MNNSLIKVNGRDIKILMIDYPHRMDYIIHKYIGEIMDNKTHNHTFRMTNNTKRHLLASSVHFGCSMGTLLDMLLDAVRIAEMPGSENPKVFIAIERFEKHLSSIDLAKHTYLFKD